MRMSAEYMRNYRLTLTLKRARADKRLFQAGVDAIRKLAFETFRGIGNGEMTGYTAMEIMRNLKLPTD